VRQAGLLACLLSYQALRGLRSVVFFAAVFFVGSSWTPAPSPGTPCLLDRPIQCGHQIEHLARLPRFWGLGEGLVLPLGFDDFCAKTSTLIKRQMYGRGSFQLLRTRVLLRS